MNKFKVTIYVENVDGVQASYADELTLDNLKYLLGVLTLNFALPLSKQLREKALLEVKP